MFEEIISQEQLRNYFIKLMNSKDIYSCGSNRNPVIFVNSIQEDVLDKGIKTGAYSDGFRLLDFEYDKNVGIDDDITKMYGVLRNNRHYNLSDFYNKHFTNKSMFYFIGQISDMFRDRSKY